MVEQTGVPESNKHLTTEEIDNLHEELFEEMYGDGKEESSSESSDNKEVTEVVEETSSEESTDAKSVEEPSKQEEQESPSQEEFSWIGDLDDDLKTKVESLKHQADSDRGRVSALNKKVLEQQNAMDAKILAEAEVARTLPSASSPKTQTEVPEQVQDMLKEYPTLGEQIKTLVSYEQNKVRDEILKELAPIKREITERQILTEREKLSTQAANLLDTENTGVELNELVKTDEWKLWLSSQPTFIKEVAKHDRTAEGSIYVLERFVESIVGKYDETSEETNRQSLALEKEKGDKVQKERQTTLEENVTIPSGKVSGGDTSLHGNYDEMFNRMWGDN